MITLPRVTVLMTVYNGQSYLAEAIASILAQSFRDFELLVINDGSADDSLAIIRSFSDPRLRLIDQHPNRGIRATLNRGLAEATGDYVAVMDQDDIAHPERLAQQVAFMDRHGEVALCGSDVEIFGERSGPSWVRHFSPAALRVALLFENPICHPSVMLRRQTLARNTLEYPDFPYAEEYSLWVRLSRCSQLANLPEKLLRYRSHAQQVSQRKSEIQCHSTNLILSEQLRRLGLAATPRDLIVHKMLGPVFNPLPGYRQRLERWSAQLLAANARLGLYPAEEFNRQVEQRRQAAIELNTRQLATLPPLRRAAWQFAVWRDYLRAGAQPSS